VSDIADLAANVVDYAKNAFCPITLTSETGTCGAGAGGLAFVIIAFLIYLTFDFLKEAVGKHLKGHPTAAAAIFIFIGQALIITNFLAIFSTFVLIAGWALFGRHLTPYALRVRGHAMRSDNAMILCAPLLYFLASGVNSAFIWLHPPPAKSPAIVLLPSENVNIGLRQDLRQVIKQIRANLSDAIGSGTFDLVPDGHLIDSEAYFTQFGGGWIQVVSAANNDRDLRDRHLKFLQSSLASHPYGTAGGTLILSVEARSLEPGASSLNAVGRDFEGIIRGVKTDSTALMSLIVSLSIIEHYARANLNPELQRGLILNYLSAFRIEGDYLKNQLPAAVQASLASGCASLECVDSIANAFRDALDNEYQTAQPALAEQASDHVNSAWILLNMNTAPQTQ
jgi:hypothetical protein